MNAIYEPMNNFTGIFAGAFVIGIILIFVFTALLKWLWNITIPGIFNLREITFWEAFRLILIAGILFGGTGFDFSF